MYLTENHRETVTVSGSIYTMGGRGDRGVRDNVFNLYINNPLFRPISSHAVCVKFS